MVVLGNISFPIARENEKKERLSQDAQNIIFPELEYNEGVLSEMQSRISENTSAMLRFDVGAWETVSRGSLLLSIKPDDIKKLISIYRLFYKANELNDQFVDNLIGLRASIGQVEVSKKLLYANLKKTLDDLTNEYRDIGRLRPKHVQTTQTATP